MSKPIYSQISIKMRRPSDVNIEFKTHLGREYIVVPAVILTEGVHVGNGDINAIFYSKDVLATNLDAWNSRPVTIGHPSGESGGLVDPDTPEILERFQIGLLFNAALKEDGKAISADVWLSLERLSTIAQKTREMIFDGEEVEVSTDMKIDAVIKKGTFQGEKFEAEAVFLHPKGLAVLENEIGACSFMDGCGIRNRACNKNKGCTECKITTLEEKNMAEEIDKNKAEGHGVVADCMKDEGFIKGVMVALASIMGQKNASGDDGGCGCRGGDKGKGGEEAAKVNEPPKPETMEQFLATAPDEFKTTISAALASTKAAEEAHAKKLKGLRTEILALDKTFTEDVTGKMDETALTTLKTALSKKPATDYSLGAGAWGEDVIVDDEILETPGWPKTQEKTN
jgi:hypothetical protein